MPDDFHFSTEVRVRLPETDAMGIVFHGCFFTYLEVGRMDYLRNLGLNENNKPIKGFDNVVAHAACDFESPARFDDPLVVHVRIAEIRRTSFRFEFRIVHKMRNQLIARGESVHVALDGATWTPLPVPEAFRRAIQAFEGDSLRTTAEPAKG
ncbi:MAG: acyl-CoA thioesterase [Planctomycetes bacterium]|nr:acyl-CoA thioesterase [Planctomycetota bacterium]